MAVAKKKPEEPTCPLWLATYGDMVTNLLVFFVLLMSLSEIKRQDELFAVLESIRDAFGFSGDVRGVPLDQDVTIPANVDFTEMLIVPIKPEDFSQTDVDGLRGEKPNVEQMRPANYYAVGGPVQFERLSTEVGAEQRAKLLELAETIRGYNTQIEVRGHASNYPLDGSTYRTHYELAYRRAENVAAVLVEAGIDAQRILVASSGTNQPVSSNAYTLWEKKQNDLVELLQTDRLVNEFRP